MTDEGQAVKALAEASGKVVDAISGVLHYAAEVFGTSPRDAVGLAFGDRLHHRRLRNNSLLEAETRELLKPIDQGRLSPPSPSVLIPLMIAAADEERDELRSLWARLLANAAIDRGTKVRREFFETVRQMEPLDALILQELSPGNNKGQGLSHDEITRRLKEEHKIQVHSLDINISLRSLVRLGCISESVGVAKQSVVAYGLALLIALDVE